MRPYIYNSNRQDLNFIFFLDRIHYKFDIYNYAFQLFGLSLHCSQLNFDPSKNKYIGIKGLITIIPCALLRKLD